MRIEVEHVEQLTFADGTPVRAASAVAALGSGFVVAQDDATHAAWFVNGSVLPLRLLPPVQGLDHFEEAAGTKHLKPDLEAACEVEVDGTAVLMLGSGSSAARTRASLVRLEQGEPTSTYVDLAPLYATVADRLAVRPEELNMEGACVRGEILSCFQRGMPSAGLPTGSVDVALGAVLDAVLSRGTLEDVEVWNPRTYDLGDVAGVGLAITDVVALPDGTLLASAVAEDSPNPRDDGPVTGSALVHLVGGELGDMTSLPVLDGRVSKVEGLMRLPGEPDEVRLLAVVDADDPHAPSLALRLRVRGLHANSS